jgi:hypothetical protein
MSDSYIFGSYCLMVLVFRTSLNLRRLCFKVRISCAVGTALVGIGWRSRFVFIWYPVRISAQILTILTVFPWFPRTAVPNVGVIFWKRLWPLSLDLYIPFMAAFPSRSTLWPMQLKERLQILLGNNPLFELSWWTCRQKIISDLWMRPHIEYRKLQNSHKEISYYIIRNLSVIVLILLRCSLELYILKHMFRL